MYDYELYRVSNIVSTVVVRLTTRQLSIKMMTPPPCRAPSKTFQQLTVEQEASLKADELFLRSVEEGNLEEVRRRTLSADLNVADERKQSAVHKAVLVAESVKVLAHLIENGAYLEYEDSQGYRPVALAIRFDNQEALKLLLAAKNEAGDFKVDFTQTNRQNGHTLLHEAAWFDRSECAALLLATGAFAGKLEAFNLKGQTAMHVAGFRATRALLQLLVEHGAQSEAATTNPRTLKETPMQIVRGARGTRRAACAVGCRELSFR